MTTLDCQGVTQIPEFTFSLFKRPDINLPRVVREYCVVVFVLFDIAKHHSPHTARLDLLYQYKLCKPMFEKNNHSVVELLEHVTMMRSMTVPVNHIAYCNNTQSNYLQILRKYELKTI